MEHELEDELEDKFIQFGCWNNTIKKGCLENVTTYLKQHLESEKITHPHNFIIVSGDNYYPSKNKDASTKIKIIDPRELKKGFDYLPTDLPIFMILGNHDLETNTKKQELFIGKETNPESNCAILNYEYYSKKKNVNYNFFKEKMLKNGTLLLMVDTSIYDDDADDYLSCYNNFFSNKSNKYYNPKYHDKTNKYENINELKQYQKDIIQKSIAKYSDERNESIRNVIIVGHHPIVYIKTKKNKDKKEKKEKEEKKEKKEKKEKEEKKDEFKTTVKSDIINKDNSFLEVLKDIYTSLPSSPKYYYLCSDLHLYQEGIIQIPVDDAVMEIKQYIVGTGGTEIDPDLSKAGKLEHYLKGTNENGSNDYEDGITYKLESEIPTCGFLECIINEVPEFQFIPLPLELQESAGGRKTSKKTKSKNTKKNKSKKNKSKNTKKNKYYYN